jgi:hypothetical protein
LKDLTVLERRPPGWRGWCWWPPDSSENESRLSVDCPLSSRLVSGGETRFSGDDSSVKLCSGGDVSELSPPDLEPTEKEVWKILYYFIVYRIFLCSRYFSCQFSVLT